MGGAVGDFDKVKLGVPMKRIVMHWSAGTGVVNGTELKHYHYVVDQDGVAVPGTHPVEANIPPLRSGSYAAHTYKLNSHSIGIAMSCMAGATERPFSWGTHPMSEKQVDALCRLAASLCTKHSIKVTPQTILTHAEVQPTLKVKQRFKWDITVLPGMNKPSDPVLVGNELRKRIKSYL